MEISESAGRPVTAVSDPVTLSYQFELYERNPLRNNTGSCRLQAFVGRQQPQDRVPARPAGKMGCNCDTGRVQRVPVRGLRVHIRTGALMLTD